MIKLNTLLVASVLLVSGPAPRQSAPATVSGGELSALAWLAGEWRGKAGDTDVVSWHSDPNGGMIVMATKELTNGKVSLFDFGIVSAKNDKVAYVPYPYGKPSVPFLLTDFDPTVERAAFVNEQHDFPKRFVFEKTKDARLRITLTGDEGGQATTVEYELNRVGAPERATSGGQKK